MKQKLLATFLMSIGASLTAEEPIITSWFTELSGQYARLYEDSSAENDGQTATTWSRGQGTQSLPTYAGVHEVSYDEDNVYIRSTGLGFHIMGPWYLNAQATNLFPNYPANRAVLYRFPRDPGEVPSDKTSTDLGVIGHFVDGVAMFDSRDAFSYSTSNNADATPRSSYRGDGVWNRDAYVNESITFDSGNAHQAGITYHYHANPPGLRFLLGDSVDYDDQDNVYSENFNGAHSPIIGWVRDGYPIYGPYGYADPDPDSMDSEIVRMRSGYQMRDGTNGTTNIPGTGRTTLPEWANRLGGRAIEVPSNRIGPDVVTRYSLGHYLEDYAYLGDLPGFALGEDFDLDEHNGRFCRTPEFPDGIYAYFVSIEANGTPKFPYNIGPYYYGTPSASNVQGVPGDAIVYFEGGPEINPTVGVSTDSGNSGSVTIYWQGAEGGRYTIEQSDDLITWVPIADEVSAPGGMGVIEDAGNTNDDGNMLYRATMEGVEPFDDSGFDY